MTKFILHGGNTEAINEDNDSFFKEMTSGLKGKVRILLNYFSRKDEKVEDCAKEDKERLLKNSENKNLEFEIASSRLFAEQLKVCNVMYMRGGDSAKLIKEMSSIPNLGQLMKNKVIAGSSAGVYVLSKYFWKNDTDSIHDGLGILNFKAYCHYNPEDTVTINQLLNYKEDLPLVVLPNCKWIVLFK